MNTINLLKVIQFNEFLACAEQSLAVAQPTNWMIRSEYNEIDVNTLTHVNAIKWMFQRCFDPIKSLFGCLHLKVLSIEK